MKTNSSRVYGNLSAQDVPAYGITEAARYLHIAPATLRSWVKGRTYPLEDETGFFEPLIRLGDDADGHLSFSNLVEAHVLRALRTEHGVSIKDVRTAIDYAERELEIDRLLLSAELRTEGGNLFLDKYVELINLSRSGQLAIRRVLQAYLKRVVWEEDLPARLYPFLTADLVDDRRVIAIDPFLAFGRPVVASRGVSTAAIADRIDSGESVAELAADYDLGEDEVEAAVVYETAA